MTPPEERSPRGSRPVAAAMLRFRLVHARASALARAGELEQAERLLVAVIRSGSAPTDLVDLLARVLAQNGRLEEAKRLWQSLRDHPLGGLSASAPLERIAAFESDPSLRDAPRNRLLLYLAISALLFFALLALLFRILRPEPVAPVVSVSPTLVPTVVPTLAPATPVPTIAPTSAPTPDPSPTAKDATPTPD